MVKLRPKYPTLARFAIDILIVLATSCECERMFSELGDLLAPRRRNIGSQLLAALQCIRSWMRDGKRLPARATALSDDDLKRLYDLASWDKPEETG
ncbi:Dimer-Tnp-hAT domain containing protein [Pyrenophora tritici-repentis]|nr:Dimer-Tnp-hAT domain-containing protein [Pyrenophora tritici-repentis]KAI1530417.1 Dimer-Tnp-hAT domain containing protein [Pyrenophora tritici-repentis]KAI1568756.1 Dimer-Tnp-hAT domain containing protein [Pyrenophora tritici-repentis]